MDLATFLKDYGAPGAWIIAGIGWTISNHHANTREKRKEFRSEIESIEKTTKLMVEKLSTYFKLGERDVAAVAIETEVIVLFREIDLKWQRLSKRRVSRNSKQCFLNCKTSLEQLFDHATSDYFDIKKRGQQEQITLHSHELHVRSLVFIEALHSLFLKEFDNI